MKWIWINIIITILLTSCYEQKNKEWQRYVANEIKAHINKEFIFPDSAFTIFPNEKIDSIKNAKWKIATYIDLDCSICIGRFYYWREFKHIADSLCAFSIPILIYVHSEIKQEEELVKIVNEQWDGIWVYDNKYEFVDKNNLHDERFHTVVLNSQNTIKLIGNPFLNKEVEKLFLKYIQNKQ